MISIGDPVMVTKQTPEGPIEIPATVVYVDYLSIGVAYSDGTRDALERRRGYWRKASKTLKGGEA